jgi:hypothetical protein
MVEATQTIDKKKKERKGGGPSLAVGILSEIQESRIGHPNLSPYNATINDRDRLFGGCSLQIQRVQSGDVLKKSLNPGQTNACA